MNDNGLGKDNVILMEKWNQKRKDQNTGGSAGRNDADTRRCLCIHP